jgi:hypothetical protein
MARIRKEPKEAYFTIIHAEACFADAPATFGSYLSNVLEHISICYPNAKSDAFVRWLDADAEKERSSALPLPKLVPHWGKFFPKRGRITYVSVTGIGTEVSDVPTWTLYVSRGKAVAGMTDANAEISLSLEVNLNPGKVINLSAAEKLVEAFF